MRKTISKRIQKQQFNPDVLGIFINPFYHMRRGLWQAVATHAPKLTGRMLDVGCGNKPYEELFKHIPTYIGMDFDSPENRTKTKADVFYDGHHFPFESNSLDSALSTEVLEHVFNPDEFLAEVYRVLKPGGLLLLTTPFAWDEHAQPFDYGRYSSFGLAHILTKTGFEIIEQHKTCPDLRALYQLASCYIYKVIPFRRYWPRVVCYVLFNAPHTIAGSLMAFLFPKNRDLYLSNVVLARKPSETQ